MEKLRIVFIDDEPLVLENIVSMVDWANGVFELAGTASNGRQGLQLCLNTHPDIAFIDIKMPIMDGLSLAREVKERGLDTELVILTAYQDFSFAQQGISIGISDYLLKHEITRASVQVLLQKLQRRIDDKRQREYMSSQNMYSAIIHHTLQDFSQLPVSENIQNPFLAVLIGQAVQPLFIGEELRQPPNPPLAVFPQSVAESLQLLFFTTVEYLNQSQVYLFKADTTSQLYHVNKLNNVSSHILHTHQSYGGKSACFVLLSFPVALVDLREAVEFAYSKLEQAMMTTMQPFTVACYASNSNWRQKPAAPTPDSSHFFRLLRRGDYGAARTYLTVDFRNDLIHSSPTRQECELTLTELVRGINIIRGEHSMAALHYSGSLPPPLYTIDQALSWLGSEVEQTAKEKQALPTIHSQKLEQAIEYIHENYRVDLTQQQVADAVGFSSVYLSVLFKRELNSTFLKYLTDYRVQVSKYLLLHTDKKVYEISMEVGYQTSQYFSQIFRQSTGMTPSQYRESKEEHL